MAPSSAIPAPQPIAGVRYRNPRWPKLGIETLLLSDLPGRVRPERLHLLQRPNFHHLFLCLSGHGHHRVDFADLEMDPGTLIQVQPGQVQQFGLDSFAEALMIIFAPEVLLSGKSNSGEERDQAFGDTPWPPRIQLESDDFRLIRRAFEDLHEEYQRTDGSALSRMLLQHLLHALLLRLRRIVVKQEATPTIPSSLAHIFRLFQKEVESTFERTREIEAYATRLGYSTRTLTRASLAMAGVTAKAFVDARVLLEGKRLLAHSELSVAQIAYQLGFSEATNFAKFFKRATKGSPLEFRNAFRNP